MMILAVFGVKLENKCFSLQIFCNCLLSVKMAAQPGEEGDPHFQLDSESDQDIHEIGDQYDDNDDQDDQENSDFSDEEDNVPLAAAQWVRPPEPLER